MSILLEALRKSERTQHPPEAPDIHADDPSGPISDSIRSGPLALLLVGALFVSGWFVWNQYQAPAGSYQPPVTLTGDKVRSGTDAGAVAVTAGTKGAELAPSGTVAENSAKRRRTPMESYQAVARKGTQAVPATSTTSEAAGSGDFHPNATSGSTHATPGTAASTEPVAPASGKPDRHQPAPISYWELPDAIRVDVPEIKFSVLVYATEPADRFVLINGQRLTEGDSPQSGLVLKEIRRDGVVFSYRLYQFLVER